MYINKLWLTNFRNYNKQKIEFSKGINIFYGDNAQGKTNIIEAIYLSSIGKSFRAKKDIELVNIKNQQFAIIDTEFEKKDRNGKIKLEIKDKKNIYINNVKAKKVSEILGNINIVLFSPDDINLFKGGPSKRRKILDMAMDSRILQLEQQVAKLKRENETLQKENEAMRKALNKRDLNLIKNF